MEAGVSFHSDEERQADQYRSQDANACHNYPQPPHIHLTPFLLTGGVVTRNEVVAFSRQDNHAEGKHDNDENNGYYQLLSFWCQ